MRTMTVSTIEGNGALLGLSQQAVSEAQSMRAITIVALVYVPASFVAVRAALFEAFKSSYTTLTTRGKDFLQMGYVVAAQQSGLVISATKGLWIYAIITIPLVVITIGIYFVFEFVNGRWRHSRKHSIQGNSLDTV